MKIPNLIIERLYKINTTYNEEMDLYLLKNDIKNQNLYGLFDNVDIYIPYNTITNIEIKSGDEQIRFKILIDR